MTNPFAKTCIEFHILQSFPVTCLNRDDVGAPKSAMVGGVPRARVSSQCWKRQVRLALHDLGVRTGIRTKRIADMITKNCLAKGADATQAESCGAILGEMLSKDTLYFITNAEIDILGTYAQDVAFTLPVDAKEPAKGKDGEASKGKIPTLPKTEITKITKLLKAYKTAADGLDIALFGRMVAQAPDLNVQAASSFAHALSTHKVSNEVEFFTALDDLQEEGETGSAHMGSLEFNSATYYRYISLDLGQLWDSLGGEDMDLAVDAFCKALYIAVPSARQTTQSGACPWEYARVLIRKGQRMQASFDKAVRPKNGFLAPSIEALNDFLERQEQLAGSLYGKIADYTFGEDLSFNIDKLAAALANYAGKQKETA